MTRIKAPYNFVPLSKKVYFPKWAQSVSQDVPFADGISGTIDCKLTAVSPLFTRDEDGTRFFRVGDQLMIPGSSLKGMIRNIIKIIGFGKMNQAADHRYSIRDLYNKADYTSKITNIREGVYEGKQYAGWLSVNASTGKWELTPCSLARVEQEDLRHLNTGCGNLRNKQTLEEKYAQWGKAGFNIFFDCPNAPQNDPNHKCGTLVYRKALNINWTKGTQARQGTIVMTGQPNRTKHMEFVFYDEQNPFVLQDRIKRDFIFVNTSPEGEPLESWKFWKPKLNAGQRIPVFYLGSSPINPDSIGLAYMYRLPYENSIGQAIAYTSKDHRNGAREDKSEYNAPDLAETIFGYTTGKISQRGRVSFSAAKASVQPQEMNEVATVLGQPKPTYYPNYVVQKANVNGNVNGDYNTYQGEVHLRGWKRYPARQSITDPIPEAPTENVETRFTPIEDQTEFTFTIHVNNLLPSELGAIYWALTWGEDESRVHSLGMAKSLGFGQVRIRVESANLMDTAYSPVGIDRLSTCMDDYIGLMKSEVTEHWAATEQIAQLLAMADPGHIPLGFTRQRDKLRHMTIEMGGTNEFNEAKNRHARKALIPHAEFNGQNDRQLFTQIRASGSDQEKAWTHWFSKQEEMEEAKEVEALGIRETMEKAVESKDLQTFIEAVIQLKEEDISDVEDLDYSGIPTDITLVRKFLEHQEGIDGKVLHYFINKFLPLVAKPKPKFKKKYDAYIKFEKLVLHDN